METVAAGVYYELNLYTVCRTCLGQHTELLDLLEIGERQKNMLEMFTTVVGLELVSHPFRICPLCEQKISMSYAFRQQCKINDEIIQQYLRTNQPQNAFESTTFDLPTPSLDKIEEYNSYDASAAFAEDDRLSDINVDVEVEDEAIKEEVEDEAIKEEETEAPPKQHLRLQQFPDEEVASAIKELMKSATQNVTCVWCGFVARNSRSLSSHITVIHKDLKDRWCSLCNSEYDDLQSHISEHKNGPLQCQFCSKKFSLKGHLVEHVRGHSETRPFKCDICSRTFISKRHLKVHLRAHTKPCKEEEDLDPADDPPQQNGEPEGKTPQNFCEECNKKVRSLTEHQQKVHGDGNVVRAQPDAKLCNSCGKQFKTNSKLTIHMRQHTGEAPYKCRYCDKRASTRNHLVVHERTHTGEKPHICHICGKRFTQTSVLNTHMFLHTGRPVVCKICGQRFCRATELRLHMRRHTGEKPYKCSKCGQAFVQQSHLKEHSKTHSDERPYKCDYCGRSFKQNSCLKAHVQIHLGYKPYRCSQCPYACRQSYSLTQHMKQHVNDAPRADKPHACQVCGRAFSTAAMMNSHFHSVHGKP